MIHQPDRAARHARLHAITAALCALLLLVALCLLAGHHAPWWVLLGVQGALLAATAAAGLWLDRGVGRRGDEAMRDGDGVGAWGRQRQWTKMRYTLPRDDDEVFWQERMGKEDDA